MSTLFVIGNGFDRAHGLKTSYWDFRKYLEKYAEDFLVQMENLYSIAPFERLDKRFKKNKNIQNRRDDAIYKTLWKNFEYGLGEANEAEMLDFSKSIVDGYNCLIWFQELTVHLWHMLTFMILEVFVKGLDILMKLKIEI